MGQNNCDIKVYHCEHIGISGTTDVHVQKTEDRYEARMGIALFGMTNMDAEGFELCNSNPFHPKFHDNYVSGKGVTEEEAIENIKNDMKETHKGLWEI